MASIPYSFECDKASAMVLNPNAHKCVGYVTALAGITGTAKLPLDLAVSLPFGTGLTPAYSDIKLAASTTTSVVTTKVVGVIEKFAWDGGVGGAINIDFWVSQQNATQIKATQQSVLRSTKVNQLGWWIVDYDQETKKWYEKSYPQAGWITGAVGGGSNSMLNVDLVAAPAAAGIDVMLYKISIGVVPASNLQYSLQFANTSSAKLLKNWGLAVGTLASSVIR